MDGMKELARLVSSYGLEAILEHVHAPMVLVDSDGRPAAWNRAFELLPGDVHEAKILETLFPVEEKGELQRRLQTTDQTGNPTQWTAELISDAQGGKTSFDCLLIPLPEGHSLFIADRTASNPALSEIVQRMHRRVKLFRIESELAKKIAINKQKEIEAVVAQADEVSHIDALTFLPNRRQIIKELQNEVLRSGRYQTPFSISMLDVDHFKRVNDSYGHTVGDELLRQIAGLLREHIRQPDLAGRYGGEEFLILLPNTVLESAAGQAERLCAMIRKTKININEIGILVTVSIGVSQLRIGGENWEQLLNRADLALYKAKDNGRDCWYAAKEQE